MRVQAKLFLLIGAIAWVGAAVPGGAQEPARPGCAHCRPERPEIAELVKRAERLHAQFKPREAARELRKVLEAEPDHFEALTMLARAHIDIGDMVLESEPGWQAKRLEEYRIAERLARKAVAVDPGSTWGHFYVAWSLGNIAMISPVGTQIDLAGEIRSAVERAIALDPGNGFAYHVYGVWHRKMAEIGRMSRLFANVVYGRSIPRGSLEQSVELLKKAIALNPGVIVSRLELAQSYIAAENWAQARALLRSIEPLPIRFSDDARHKQKAKRLLEEIRNQ
ncbi:MAG TPA: tetratricopeptide repeat protein [candidate division Zixibacteria bacterium]|nr:tetratricopeptide repeat protein [candidate division Zixibacteria bacterium]